MVFNKRDFAVSLAICNIISPSLTMNSVIAYGTYSGLYEFSNEYFIQKKGLIHSVVSGISVKSAISIVATAAYLGATAAAFFAPSLAVPISVAVGAYVAANEVGKVIFPFSKKLAQVSAESIESGLGNVQIYTKEVLKYASSEFNKAKTYVEKLLAENRNYSFNR